MSKIKVLDLFAGTQSVRKSLDSMGVDYDYKGIDIYSPQEENILVDLSKSDALKQILKKLKKWKPDIIWASPVCNRFSAGVTGKGGNAYFIIDDSLEHGIRPRLPNEIDGVFKRFQKFVEDGTYTERARQAMVMHINMKKIIEHFNVPFAVENPATAMTRHMYKKWGWKRSVCHYCAYDWRFKKPTAIYSNMEFELLKCPHPRGYKHEGIQDHKYSQHTVEAYSLKASVPPKLIKVILEKLINKG